MSELRLTSADQRRLRAATTALLSPLAHDTLDGWRRAVCRRMKELTGADMVTFQLPVRGEDALFSEEIDRTFLDVYLEALAPVEEELAPTARFRRLGVYDRDLLWGERIDEYYRTEYYNTCIRPARAYDALSAAVLLREDATEPRMSGKDADRGAAILYHHHDHPDRTPFGRRGRALLRLLHPAFESGVRTWMRHRDRRGSVLRVLDRIRDAAVLANGDGDILHENRTLDRVAAEDPRGPEVRAALREAARSPGAGPDPEEPAADRPAGEGGPPWIDTPRGRYRLRTTLLDDPARPGRRLVLAWTAPPDRHLPDPHELEERHGLTPREAAVALLLARRLSTGEMARRLEISPHTVRRHIENVFLKLGVHSRQHAGRIVRGEPTG